MRVKIPCEPLDIDEEAAGISESSPLLSASNGGSVWTGSYNPFGSHNRRHDFLTKIGRRAAELYRGKSKPKGPAESLSDVLQEMEDEERSSWRFFLFALVGIVTHIIGGTITLCMLEHWSILDSFYFCIVSTTSVGYGDMVPQTAGGKLFVSYYVLYALALIVGMLGYIVGLLIERQEELMLAALSGHNADNWEEQDLSGLAWLFRKEYKRCLCSFFFFVLMLFVGVLAFVRGQGLSLVDGLYVATVSACTVGYGDFSPRSGKMKLFASVWLVLSTLSLAKVVADFANLQVYRKQNQVTKRLLAAQMDVCALRALDSDKSGTIDKAEYLAMMLVRTGKVEREEVIRIIRKFDSLDKDSSGTIDQSECCN